MSAIIRIESLSKRYEGGTHALRDINLDIIEGEIIALLGPNGAGKTTLISTICGLVRPTEGRVTVGGYDIQRDWRAARKLIGMVPQEIALEPFITVEKTVVFSRGLYGLAPDPEWIERILRALALWDKRDQPCKALSGGMKRRVLIAKALSHRPKILFLDEPTAGVDIALRRDMWSVVRDLRREGVTIILTTHYLEEAEEMADRIGVMRRGELLLVRQTSELLGEFGRKQLSIQLDTALAQIPAALVGQGGRNLTLSEDGHTLIYEYDRHAERTGIAQLMGDLAAQDISVRDLVTQQSSLEEIFLDLVEDKT